ncbi:hypothetical protein O3W44_22320 [Pantoea sp. LMR881]|uniref:crAss001_48 related protein n=1 Tax=Pantoea sp. LMR881 TaxID=3014336 RepID=UPI0022AF8871|nr:hypothetical protein [Pantoea sp. LMR881]MCZ4061152.1 hypothetical protein [Pantoea sp. LMR881]MCZ4061269.1 hypothetical protein [Pantoea sp. LMR881]
MTSIKELPPFVQRMCEERTELKNRIDKASAFTATTQYAAMSSYDRTLFDIQLEIMNYYLNLLKKRIERTNEQGKQVD